MAAVFDEGSTANLICRAELDAAADPEARGALHRQLTDELKNANTAIEVASRFRCDDVIDPADTREVLLETLATVMVAAAARDPQEADRAVLRKGGVAITARQDRVGRRCSRQVDDLPGSFRD